MAPESSWNPDWSVAPGEILRETLEELDMTQSELARRMNRPVKTLNEIVNAKAAITPETALQLELSLGISAAFWNSLEMQYRLSLARRAETESLKSDEAWARSFPLKALAERGAMPGEIKGSEAVRAVLRFFGVSSQPAWEQQWGVPLARFKAARTYESVPTAVAAWLRLGELRVQEADLGEFDSERFAEVLRECRHLTRRRPFALAVQEAAGRFASAGVALVVLAELPGTRLSGAARWLAGRRPMIQVSLRYKTADQVWFAILHESAHILLHPRDVDFLDEEGVGGPREEEANAFARSLLVPDADYDAFVAAGAFGAESIAAFASTVDVAPGVVLGRLQRDGHVHPSKLNTLKERLRS